MNVIMRHVGIYLRNGGCLSLLKYRQQHNIDDSTVADQQTAITVTFTNAVLFRDFQRCSMSQHRIQKKCQTALTLGIS